MLLIRKEHHIWFQGPFELDVTEFLDCDPAEVDLSHAMIHMESTRFRYNRTLRRRVIDATVLFNRSLTRGLASVSLRLTTSRL